jgi:hypothetical protein
MLFEVLLIGATLLGGLAALWFFWDKFIQLWDRWRALSESTDADTRLFRAKDGQGMLRVGSRRVRLSSGAHARYVSLDHNQKLRLHEYVRITPKESYTEEEIRDIVR